ncbi:hypothetical protein CEXT_669521 [Caerostris extrusa]|uniref:C2H2-type domain-containing protein n=1 Tax=Caerostris extrusa TaxID=172846 RepID=A0AAV4VU56_CAEEX|nr:hypothetical protein CEXT_669521 [Caerostris extrusa]
MSEDERKADSFGETFKDEEEDPARFENLRRTEVGRNMQNRPGTGNAMLSEPPAELFHRMSGPRNPLSSDMGAEGGQNTVRTLENIHQSADYFFSQRTSNKRSLSITNDSLTRCSVWSKKMRYSVINLNESSCEPLDLSIRGASNKTCGISSGENSSCQMTQSNTSASSAECSSSALSSSKKSRDQGKKHVCDVCKKEFPFFCRLKAHMLIHNGEKPFVCKTCLMAFSQFSYLKRHIRIHTGETPYSCEICQRKFARSSNLKSHKEIHSGINLHCDYCDFETPQKNSLNRHLKKYHSEHKEKCPVCCNYFYSKKSLKSHKCKNQSNAFSVTIKADVALSITVNIVEWPLMVELMES